MEFDKAHRNEIPAIDIFLLMKENIYNYQKDKNVINIDKIYIAQRKTLIYLIKKISLRMNFKSRTFYEAVNYLDIIFNKQKEIKYNYILLAAACLITASKFLEIIPRKPTFHHFINIANEIINNNEFKISKEDLFLHEIIICKILDYKLNYFTIYDFNFFFFGNGMLKIEHLIQISNLAKIDDSLKRKILIKIYERSRLYLNNIINNLICINYNCLLISIYIMEKSIDYVLIKEFNRGDSFNIDEIKVKNKKYFREIMKEFYKIDFESSKDYQYLKLDCEKYKIFEDNNNVNDLDINKNQSEKFSNLFVNKSKIKIASSKSSSKNKKVGESFRKRKYNQNENKLLYKKVNIIRNENNKNYKMNIKQKLKKEYQNNDNEIRKNTSKISGINNNFNMKIFLFNKNR